MTMTRAPRQPRVFDPDDPSLVHMEPVRDAADTRARADAPPEAWSGERRTSGRADRSAGRTERSGGATAGAGLATAAATARQGVRWGAMLMSALAGLAMLATARVAAINRAAVFIL